MDPEQQQVPEPPKPVVEGEERKQQQPKEEEKAEEKVQTTMVQPTTNNEDAKKQQIINISLKQNETEQLPKNTAQEIKSDEPETITKTEQILQQSRDPIIQSNPVSTEENKTETEVKKQEKKQEKQEKTEQKIQQKVQEEKEVNEVTSENQGIVVDSKNISVEAQQKPIDINLGKDVILIEEQKISAKRKEPDVKIEINQVIEKGHTFNKQVFYRIVGFDKHGPIDILRKVSQFESLRKILLERWPGCFVPQISQKSEVNNQKKRELHKRRNLEHFLRKLAYCEQIYYKEEIQLFLRSIGIQIEEMFTQMPVLRAKDVIERYKVCYGQLVEKPSQPGNAAYISRFSTSLKKISNNLKNLVKRALKLAESYQSYQEALPQFSKFLAHYEQSCLSEYTNSPNSAIALRDNQGKLNKLGIINEKQNVFYQLYFMLEGQTRDADALCDIILAMEMFNLRRDELEVEMKETRAEIQQISLGNKTMRMRTSRKTKQEIQVELQEKEKNLIQQKHVVVQLFGIAQIILANITIPLFKRLKINAYFAIIKSWMDLVGETNLEMYQAWRYLSEQSKGLLRKDKKN